jgi:HEPN domain-containing protein
MAEQLDLARELLALADDDLVAAYALSEASDVSSAILGFHAQQAVEKALKAVLALHSVEFPFTHDLEGLLELCSASAIDIPEALADAPVLTPYGVRFRYGPIDAEDLVDPAVALALAGDAVAWARTVLDGA